jgi:hypothetical protein
MSPADRGADAGAGSGPPYVEEALSADAEVVEQDGRWLVYLVVVLASGAVRRQVGDFPDRRRAEQAGRIIERNARRHIRPAGWRETGPTYGGGPG